MTQDEFEDFLDNWLIRQFRNERDVALLQLREGMLDVYEGDPEYWVKQSLWNLHDHAVALGCLALGMTADHGL
jgi:hypothetical protein